MSNPQQTRFLYLAIIAEFTDPERFLRTRRAESRRSQCVCPEAFSSMGVKRVALFHEIVDIKMSETGAAAASFVILKAPENDAGAEAVRDVTSKMPYFLKEAWSPCCLERCQVLVPSSRPRLERC